MDAAGTTHHWRTTFKYFIFSLKINAIRWHLKQALPNSLIITFDHKEKYTTERLKMFCHFSGGWWSKKGTKSFHLVKKQMSKISQIDFILSIEQGHQWGQQGLYFKPYHLKNHQIWGKHTTLTTDLRTRNTI